MPRAVSRMGASSPYEPAGTVPKSAAAAIRPMRRAASRRGRENWLPSVLRAFIARATSGGGSGWRRSGASCTDG
eukprot:14835721-Alexandrium_andersonii.AAC.1